MNHNTGLRDFTQKRLVVLRQTDSAYTAARTMKDNDIGCVLVCDKSGKLTGILSDRDLVIRVICEGFDPALVELRHLMTTSPAALGADQTVDDALWVMSSLGVRRIPVVSSQGKPIGLVTFDELVGGLEHTTGLRGVVARQNARLSRYNPEGVANSKRGAGPSAYSISPEDFHLALEMAPSLLHQTRASQHLSRLIAVARECLEERNIFVLERDQIEAGLTSFLSCLIRRVVPGAAGNLIDQLPKLLQEKLYSEPAGPDRSIDLEVVERVVRKCMQLRGEQGAWAAEALAEAITLSVSPGEVRALCGQLPKKLRALFEEPTSHGLRYSKAA